MATRYAIAPPRLGRPTPCTRPGSAGLAAGAEAGSYRVVLYRIAVEEAPIKQGFREGQPIASLDSCATWNPSTKSPSQRGRRTPARWPTAFETPNSLQRFAGKAPVTGPSVNSEFVIYNRLACNRYLRICATPSSSEPSAACKLRNGPGILRRPTSSQEGAPRGPQNTRQPLARGTPSLSVQPCRLRRADPNCPPQALSPGSCLPQWLTNGVSLQLRCPVVPPERVAHMGEDFDAVTPAKAQWWLAPCAPCAAVATAERSRGDEAVPLAALRWLVLGSGIDPSLRTTGQEVAGDGVELGGALDLRPVPATPEYVQL